MARLDVVCRDELRRQAVRQKPGMNGFDYLEVSEDQRQLTVYFLGKAPAHIGLENLAIRGGRRVTGIRVIDVAIHRQEDPELDDCMDVFVDRFGDWSTYTLCAVNGEGDEAVFPGFDPRYACLDFSFKIDCPSDLDCAPQSVCASEARTIPEINYLAKDYASFKQLIYDRLALLMPDWRERHAPDLGVALVELLAYVGDHLSYYQDAVATEVYLDTARQRISVRRHARLVDYYLHEGCNARAWVHVWVSQNIALNPEDFYFISQYGDAGQSAPLHHLDLPEILPKSFLIFEPLVEDRSQSLHFYRVHNEIKLYTWGDQLCCLPKGATAATLLDPGESDRDGLVLHSCDLLLFEEVKGAKTGNPADADPRHRHVVRLTGTEKIVDSLTGQRLLEVQWGREDALPFALCISSTKADDCSLIADISVARGNLLLADHGETVKNTLPDVPGITQTPDCEDTCGGHEIGRTAGRYRPQLPKTDLIFSQPLPACRAAEGCPLSPAVTPASRLSIQDVRQTLAWIRLLEKPIEQTWLPRQDLLGSGADDRHFVVEVDDRRYAHLRFGDGELGRAPSADSGFSAEYRIGGGTAGNIGAETLTLMVFRDHFPDGIELRPRNPLPAQGGQGPEALAEAKLFAPHAFRDQLQRAIIPDDYAALVMRDFADRVQRAAATLRWTGSWFEVLVAVDPWSENIDTECLLADIRRYLDKFRRIGHDVRVGIARYVALEIALHVCSKPDYLRAQVKAAFLETLSNRRLADGSLGFFHPDRLSFGNGIYLSRLIAAAQAVTGVESVAAITFKRQFQAANREIEDGVLALGPLEIARLDNDRNFPENGKLDLIMEGGR